MILRETMTGFAGGDGRSSRFPGGGGKGSGLSGFVGEGSEVMGDLTRRGEDVSGCRTLG